MLILFTTACCGVTEAGKIWACPDGETLEVDQDLGAELIRCGYGVAAGKPEAKPKVKVKSE